MTEKKNDKTWNDQPDLVMHGPVVCRGWERVPDPTPAIIDDEPASDARSIEVAREGEAARQERIDATARLLFSRPECYSGTVAYEDAESLEEARSQYIAKRKKGSP